MIAPSWLARHIVAAAYRTLFVSEKPDVLKAELALARHKLTPTTAYLRVLPDTDEQLIAAAVQEAR